jgi:putative transposase
MVGYRRNRVEGGVYFFTLALADRRSTMLVDHSAALREAFHVANRERPFVIDAIVILPNHLHAILALPEGDADYSGRWRRIKGHFSSALLRSGMPIRRHGNGELALWQRRYWEHTISDETDFMRHIDYIHYNPVKHGLVARVRDWPHSSFHRYVRCGLLPQDWAGDARESSLDFGETSERFWAMASANP